MVMRAFEHQLRGDGFSFVEILTMCPTGWFIPTSEGPDYLNDVMAPIHRLGELKAGGIMIGADTRDSAVAPTESKS